MHEARRCLLARPQRAAGPRRVLEDVGVEAARRQADGRDRAVLSGGDDHRAAMLRRAAASSEAAAGSPVLRASAHRPYPLPEGHWVQAQTWRDLLFAHWPVDPEALRPSVPMRLPIDTFDGRAWVAVTPFEVTGLRPRGGRPVPGLSRFAEVNVRTYTTLEGRPGVFFLSLDAAGLPAVVAARAIYRLPYFPARMSIERAAAGVSYRCERIGSRAGLAVRYRPAGPVAEPAPGTIEHFLTERYCLYTVDRRGRARRAEIHHPPWRLRAAEAVIARNTMAATAGIALPPGPPARLHFSARQDVVIWPPRAVG
jgi:uncharacterized protein